MEFCLLSIFRLFSASLSPFPVFNYWQIKFNHILILVLSYNYNIEGIQFMFRSFAAMYSNDLRERVVWLKFGLRYKCSNIARVLCISYGTVYRIVNKFLRTGKLECEKDGRPRSSSLHIYEQYILLEVIFWKNPSLTLSELAF